MVELIYAKKGSGKTKRLIDMANAEVRDAKGHVVFVDDDKRYMYDVVHQVRFVDVTEYNISGGNELYGFLCGMAAQNFDIQAVYIDAFLKLAGMKAEESGDLIRRIARLGENCQIKFVIIMSGDPELAPPELREYMI